MNPTSVIPADAGIQVAVPPRWRSHIAFTATWTPADAGVTVEG